MALTGAPVCAAVAFYGLFAAVGAEDVVPSPHNAINSDAPPFLVLHGSQDALVRREDARAFARELRGVSRNPVTYAELPGANHNFDFFPSLRMAAVSDAVQRFTELVLQAGGTGQPRTRAS